METQTESLVAQEVKSVQCSAEIQYLHFSFPIPQNQSLVDVQLGFRRSTDLDAADKAGQDYAAARGGDGYIVGIVADGVGQSFYGNLAASFIAEQLLEYLWDTRSAPPTVEVMTETLMSFQCEFKDAIEQFELPQSLPSLLRQALETTRRIDGSQAVFSAFILNGLDGVCQLYQVGDVDAVVQCYGSLGECGLEVIEADPKGRWSSSGRTSLKLQATLRTGIERVLLKSDGAKDWGASLTDDEVNEESFRGAAGELADYDDVSFVAAFVRPDPAQGQLSEDKKKGPPLPPDESGSLEDKGDDVGVQEAEAWSAATGEVREAEPPAPQPVPLWQHPYFGVFTAGVLAGASLMILLYFFLAYAGLVQRVSLRGAAQPVKRMPDAARGKS